MDDCIIVRIMGGLGNQMFQYALGRYVSSMCNVPLKLDLSTFNEPYEKRSYALDCYQIKATIADTIEIDQLRKRPFFLTKLLRQCLGRHTGWVRENACHVFSDSIQRVKAPVFLEGYWQCFQYVNEAKPLLEEDFQLKSISTEKNESLFVEMMDSPSVSIHVRRGDYVSNAEFNAVHGLCSLDYYANAIDFLEDSLGRIKCYVFSDDPLWVRTHLSLPKGSVVLDPNETHPQEDLRLMSACRHHIIANSSFSWWGAFLGWNSEKKVVAPREWYANGRSSGDLIPEEWVQL